VSQNPLRIAIHSEEPEVAINPHKQHNLNYVNIIVIAKDRDEGTSSAKRVASLREN